MTGRVSSSVQRLTSRVGRTFAALALAAALPAAGCRSGGAPPAAEAPAMPASQAAAVRGAVEQWRQAYEVRSLEALARRYAQAEDTVVVQQGGQTRGWTAISALLTERLARAKDVRVRLKDVVVVALGQGGASLVAGMTREVSDGVTTVTEEGTLTLTLRDAAGEWVIVAEHYSYAAR
jgi:ketosteroid isomerase-like protein